MENIQVIVRVRPTNPLEKSDNDLEIWHINGESISIATERYTDLVRMRKFLSSQRVEFSFNHCFDQKQSTTQIYTQQIRRIALSALQGINGTIFMYGQTGSGKTFSMMGPHGIEPIQPHQNKSQQAFSLASTVSATPKNLLKEIPLPSRPQTSSMGVVPRRNNSHRSPSHRTKDKTPQRQDSNGQGHDADTPDKLNLVIKRASQNDFRQFESENDRLNQDGLLVLSLSDLFYEIEKQQDKQFLLRCSYVEIYTDQAYDLLKPQDRLSEILSINEDHNKEFFIKGALEEIVTSIEDIIDIIRKGEANRHYASTIMNHVSSRSHTIFRLYVRCIPNLIETTSVITESILNFVDLAGSEKINIHDSIIKKRGQSVSSNGNLNDKQAQSTAFKDRTNESKHINKSLFYLTQVISLRSQGQRDQHIPYRNSPLTKILRSSLGGNSRTVVILCVNPCFSQFEQTLSTLRFGQNAKQIRNVVQKNVVGCENEEALNRIINDYERKINFIEKDHNSRNENLQKMIEKLHQERELLLRNKYNHAQQLSRTDHLHSIFKNGTPPKAWVHIHYPGVGVLQVPAEDSKSPNDRSFETSSTGKSMKREANLLKQIKLCEDKIKVIFKHMDEQSQRKQELVQQTMKLDKKHERSKVKLSQARNQNALQAEEIRKLRLICGLYHGQLSMDQCIFLDPQTVDKAIINLQVTRDNLMKTKIYKEISSRSINDGDFNRLSQLDSLRLKSETATVFQYPKLFLENSHSHHTYFDEDPLKPQQFEEGLSEIMSSVRQFIIPFYYQSSYVTQNFGEPCTSPSKTPSEFESFQNYFHQGQISNWCPPTDLIDHQLSMLKQDYEILRMDTVKVDPAEYHHKPKHLEDVQTSIQSIQSFKEPAAHYSQNKTPPSYHPIEVYVTAPVSVMSSSPALKERHKTQFEELLQMQQQMHHNPVNNNPSKMHYTSYQQQNSSSYLGKENSMHPALQLDFSKKTNSVPFVDEENNFQKYFDQRKLAKQY